MGQKIPLRKQGAGGTGNCSGGKREEHQEIREKRHHVKTCVHNLTEDRKYALRPELAGPLSCLRNSMTPAWENLPWNGRWSSFLPFGAFLSFFPHTWSQTDVPERSRICAYGGILRPCGQAPTPEAWPDKVIWVRKKYSSHKWTALLSPPLGPLPVFLYVTHCVEGRCNQHQRRSHARHTVIMSSRVQKKTPLEDVLFYTVCWYKKIPNGRFNMTRKWITPIFLHTLGRIMLVVTTDEA